MATDRTVAVNLQELQGAVEFVGAGVAFDNCAYICRETGRIYWQSDEAGLGDDDLPDDIEDDDRYVAVPSPHDLGLGRRLALAFVAGEMPDDYETVAGFFRHRGAYRRFKDLLEARGRIERWYEFENRATEEALRDWCTENGFEPVADEPA